MYRWILSHRAEIGSSARKISLVSDSGGCLFAAALQIKSAKDKSGSEIEKSVYINPAFDLRNPGEGFYGLVTSWYLSGANPNDELVSPIMPIDMTKSKTILLVHGNFVNEKTWASWKARYESRGYQVITPANPGHEGDPSELRKNVHPKFTTTGFKDIVANIVRIIDTLPEKPLVIGHSMAGMVVQKLAALEKIAAGVSIDGAPPKNVFPLSRR